MIYYKTSLTAVAVPYVAPVFTKFNQDRTPQRAIKRLHREATEGVDMRNTRQKKQKNKHLNTDRLAAHTQWNLCVLDNYIGVTLIELALEGADSSGRDGQLYLLPPSSLPQK